MRLFNIEPGQGSVVSFCKVERQGPVGLGVSRRAADQRLFGLGEKAAAEPSGRPQC